MSKSGWFTVSRDIKDHWVWDCEFSNGQAWIDLIMHASHSSDRKKVIKGQMIQWGRGEQIRSIVTLSETWGWSRKRVTKFLKMLEDDGMISLKKGHLTTVISVCNYDTFQSKGTAKVTPDGTSEEHQGNISGTAKVTQITMSTMEDNSNNGKQLSNLPAKADQKSDLDLSPFLSIGFTQSQVSEIWQIRKANKGKPIKTQRVINSLAKEFYEASKGGMTIDGILNEWATRGWQSFKAEWVLKSSGQPQQKAKWDNTESLASELTNMFDQKEIYND